MINAVMLGAIAASGRLPISRDAFAAAVRAGKAAEANLRGFRGGVRGGSPRRHGIDATFHNVGPKYFPGRRPQRPSPASGRVVAPRRRGVTGWGCGAAG